MHNKKNIYFSFPLLLLLVLFTVVSGSGKVLEENYQTGTLDIKHNEQVIGQLLYRSIESGNTAVTTLEPDYGGIAPFHPYFGQSLNFDDKLFYLSNTIAGFEIFQDSNGNGFIDSTNEIKYFVMLNATQDFSFSDISIVNNDESTVYEWNSTYYEIDGFLVEGIDFGGYPSTTTLTSPFNKLNQGNDLTKTIISTFNISYTLVDSINHSDLSIKYDIGLWDTYTFTLDTNGNEIRTGEVDLTGFGLSIIYTSIVRSTDLVDRVELSNNDLISDIQINYGDNVIFQSSLDESYNLGGETTQIPVKTVIADPSTLLVDQANQWNLNNDYLEFISQWTESKIDLPGIADINLPIQEIFNYRIAYPNWDGKIINHDPTYRINKFGAGGIILPSVSIPTSDTVSLVVVSGLAGLVVFGIVTTFERRK